MTARGRHRMLRSRQVSEDLPNRVRELAEAGARGRFLTPVEVKEVCEALQTQDPKPPAPPTHFSSFG